MTLDERIEALTFNLELESRMRQDAEASHKTWIDRHEASHKTWMDSHKAALQQHEAIMQRIDRRLDRAIRVGIQEARHERKRHQELQELFRKNEERLNRFLERGGNGKA